MAKTISYETRRQKELKLEFRTNALQEVDLAYDDFFDNEGYFLGEETFQGLSAGQVKVIKKCIKYVPQELSFGERLGRGLHEQQGWLFVLPAVLLMCLFTFYPIVNSFINAFHEYDYFAEDYIGWGFYNFARVFKGDTGTGGANFVQCLVNTMVLTFVSVPLSTVLALLISVTLNSIKGLQKAFQTVLFLPYLTNSLAMGAVFATFFKVIGTKSNVETYGIVNDILMFFGKEYRDWVGLRSPVWNLGNLTIPWGRYVVMIVYEVWSGLPFKILILFSALQSVNKQYYDAARVDGASKNRILWKITTPLISPMISYLIITGLMGGMKQYTAVVGVFGDDMGGSYIMGTMVGYIYTYVGKAQEYAYAGSLILFAIIMVFTVINLRVSKKRVHY